ncbi:MAG: Broad-specificity glycerol dehydrogenase [Alphaproteobacteria bacterium]|nr:Broad-specificity glycerol dehydrogenase [Alphaproteobacteria bacterium]
MQIVRHTAAVLLALLGTLLVGGGTWLLLLGGSAYYLLAGLLVGASGIFLWRGRAAAALAAYGLLFAGTLPWALW